MNSTEFLKLLKNPGQLNQETLPEIEDLIRTYPAFDMGWGVWIRNLKNTNPARAEKELSKAALRVQNRRWLKTYLDVQTGTGTSEFHPGLYLTIADYTLEQGSNEPANPPQQENKMSLIDQFLEHGSDLTRNQEPNKATPYADLAERAVTEYDDNVTETFVNILVSQGKHEKAVEAFTKLSLKYPEKSIYFAARIEELKSILKR
jgi:hypothetical protein